MSQTADVNVNRRTLGARRTLTRRHPARGRDSAWTRQSDLYVSPYLALVARRSSGGLNNASALRHDIWVARGSRAAAGTPRRV
jgi:hypothetical protein